VVRAGRPADPNDRSAYIEGVVGHKGRSHVRHTLGYTVGGADALQSQPQPTWAPGSARRLRVDAVAAAKG
jgi:hypothetical protein